MGLTFLKPYAVKPLISVTVTSSVDFTAGNVIFYLSSNGDNNDHNYTFQDLSPASLVVTKSGNPAQSALSPYGTSWSNYFDGNHNYLSFHPSEDFLFPGDFTWECWINWSGIPNYTGVGSVIYATGGSGSNDQIFVYDNGAVYCFGITSGAGAIPVNRFVHVAICRKVDLFGMFVDGRKVAEATRTGPLGSSTNVPFVGIRGSYDHPWNGLVSQLRLVKGHAVYDPSMARISVPPEPLQAIPGTSLLTCQSPTLGDNSAVRRSINIYGRVPVSPHGPLAPQTYNATVLGGSCYFNGTSFLTVPDSAGFNLSASNLEFTIEAWVFNEGPNQHRGIVSSRGTGLLEGWCLYIRSDNTLWMGSAIVGQNYADRQMNPIVMPSHSWNHVALVKRATGYVAYLNGVAGPLLELTGGLGYTGRPTCIGALSSSGEYPFVGYLADVRITKGAALYTSNFTSGSSPLLPSSSTSLLLRFANFGVYDTARRTLLKTSGNVSVSTSVKRASANSVYFDGAALVELPSDSLNWGTSDFTIDGWAYPTSARPNCLISRNWHGNNKLILTILPSGAITVWLGHAAAGWYAGTYASTPCAALHTWYHVALVRQGSTITAYVNGAAVLTGTCTATMTDSNTTPVYLGYYYGDGSYSQLYLSDFRLTKGVARYTSNFTPGFDADVHWGQVSLLVGGSTLTDSSQYATQQLTSVGDVRVDSNIVKYGAGSIAFDGQGGYLATSGNDSMAFGVGDFTIEAWIRPSYFSGDKVIVNQFDSWASQLTCYFGTRAGSPNIIVFRAGHGAAIKIEGNTALVVNTWHHVAACRRSGVTRLFVDGVVQIATHTGTVDIQATNARVRIGQGSDGMEGWSGNLADLRITKGAGRYTADFAVPTAQFILPSTPTS